MPFHFVFVFEAVCVRTDEKHGMHTKVHRVLPIETYAFWTEREWNRIMWRLLLTICVNEKDEQLIAFISCQLQMMHAIVHRHFILRFMCSKLVEIMCTIALSLPTSHQVNTYFYNRSTIFFSKFLNSFPYKFSFKFSVHKKSVERRKMNAPNQNNVSFLISFFRSIILEFFFIVVQLLPLFAFSPLDARSPSYRLYFFLVRLSCHCLTVLFVCEKHARCAHHFDWNEVMLLLFFSSAQTEYTIYRIVLNFDFFMLDFSLPYFV